ncbi:MAG: BACON domain-containing protein [Bacteroidales bacterium]|uniref:BACON domain-containing protein n=1 Tax=Porphyromonas sp. TaxID=1924944 RepID=UPI0029745750|nr:BACON domain-containing protein [Porphyromonas sp.]MDD7438775.1 BACON domain-containing protein [Bacteroidales bacterium]MDY3067033.1 BACON domain-containing protein [Porphyromonas sp.]
MKKISLLLTVLLALVFSSCANNDLGVVSLELSEFGSMEVVAEGAEKTIDVTTNQKDWIVSANAPWVEIEQMEKQFKLSIPRNNLPEARKATVVVMAGGAARKIELIQSAGKGELFVTEETLSFDQFAQDRTLRVVSNNANWEVEISEPSWISVEKIIEDNRLKISVAENVSEADRQGKVFIKSAGTIREINVSQSGKVYYLLPLLTPGANPEDVRKFEAQRKSSLVLDKDYIISGIQTFRTISPIFPRIVYNFSDDRIYEIDMIPDDALTLTSDGFHKFLLDNGFESKGDNGFERPYTKMVKIGEANFELRLQILYAVPGQPRVAKFLIFNRQSKKMPTYAELPKGFANIKTGTKPDVIAWEASNGGKLSQSKSTGNFFYYDVLDKIYIGRDYIFNDDGSAILQMRMFTYDIDKVFYLAGPGNYQMTDEFKELLEREGYTNPVKVNDAFKWLYRNEKQGTVLGVRVVQIQGVNGGAPVVMFMYLPISVLNQ